MALLLISMTGLQNTASGLMQEGLLYIKSIKAFVYCFLGVQFNVWSSILGAGGRPKEAKRKFLV